MPVSRALSSIAGRFRSDREPARLHRWGVATATTVDGATAEVQVDYVLALARAHGGDVEATASDAVEERVRQVITSARVADLPLVGDRAAWAEDVDVPGAIVEQAVVTRSDLQVTPELRRLVASPDPRAAWT